MPSENPIDKESLLVRKKIPEVDKPLQPPSPAIKYMRKGLFLMNADGRRLFCKYWASENSLNFTPKGLVFIAHGYAEHCLRYTQLAHILISQQFFPFSHDHVGHGQSEGSMVSINKFDVLVRDVIQHIKIMQEKYPNLPVYIIGHSMGGCIALRAYLKEPLLIKKLVLIGAAIIPFRQMKNICLFVLLKFLGNFLPEIPLFIKIDPKQLTSNKQQVALIQADPLIYNGFMKAGFIKIFVDALYNLEENLPNIKCPLFILHGEQDQIVTPSHSRALYERSTSDDKTLRIFPELHHQLHAEREPDGGFIRQEIADWLLIKEKPIDVLDPSLETQTKQTQ